MSEIHLLTEDVCNRIAAGEVVERPASVVKELVENSLDAGAARISIAIEDAGRRLIAVRDDGCGMDGDDAMLCFESHATSKIRTEEDIFAIQSFGFRGEAVPSIASVAKITLRTRRKTSPEGFEVTVHGGRMISSNPVGCAPGTEISARDLFYNLPARKKFMRSAATEERHIVECVTNIALANPAVSFELKIDGRDALVTPAATDPVNRLRELFGKNYADAMLPLNGGSGGIRVGGFISKRSYTKAARSEQRVFVNLRPVESPAVYRGIRDGYGPMIEKGRYPVAVLFLTLEPGFADVNVHPAKREVRFRDDFAVTAAVRSAVTAALRAADPVIPPPPGPENSMEKPGESGARMIRSLYPDFAPGERSASDPNSSIAGIMRQALVEYQVTGTAPALKRLSDLLKNPPDRKDGTDGRPDADSPVEYFKLTADKPAPDFVEQEPDVLSFAPEELRDFPQAATGDGMLFQSYKMRVLGIMENSYIIGVISDGLVLIDQHAAHERVLFEKLLKGVDGVLSQQLLFPIPLELSRADMQFVLKNLKEFEKAGFEIDPFGDLTIKLSAIPSALPQDNAGGIFLDLLSQISDRGSAQVLPTHAIATAACKAAVKAHDKLTPEECDALIGELAKCELPFSCPHGRPTVLNISLNEIERRFGRK